MLPPVTLLLGGARSGKSRHGERLVESQAGACVYLATAEAGDAEMAERIRLHRARRGRRWRTLEEPLDLVGSLRGAAGPEGAVLVDCLTLWLSNLMGAGLGLVQTNTGTASSPAEGASGFVTEYLLSGRPETEDEDEVEIPES